MSTVREIFHDAIEQGDWTDIRRVYEAIVGEEAPHPPLKPKAAALDDVLGQDMPTMERAPSPLDRVLESAGRSWEPVPANESSLTLIDDQPDPDSVMVDLSNNVAPDVLPAIQPVELPVNDVASEFYIEHGEQQHAVNDDGESQCRKESMQIPSKRENRFRDNGKAFKDEKVTENPDDPSLGIQSIRPRGLVRDAELGANTGSLTPVICKLCGKTEDVAPRLAVGFNNDPDHNTYKCNECNTPNGRTKALRKQREEALQSGGPRRGTDTQRR
jgi:hypothetical protein